MPKPSHKTSREIAVALHGCTVSYGDHIVVENVSFDVPRGTVAAIIGPNGSGKTTLLKAMLGLIEMNHGDVLIFGAPIDEMRDRIGYVPQRLEFDLDFPITVEEFMDLARHHHCPKSRIAEMLDEVGLKPDIARRQLGRLSGGQLQRVLIAQALLNEPWLLVLDEPSTGIDIVGEEAFLNIIRHLKEEHHTTVLMVSHELAVVSRLVDNVICLNREMLCYGTPKSALTAETIARVFGEHARMVDHDHHKKDHPKI
ncbi:MAG: metal ABC transporter ATP-binding protein [Patescibacteria group bacterium]